MKSIVDYIYESVQDDNIPANILTKEFSQSKFPKDWKFDRKENDKSITLSKSEKDKLASGIFGARYGNKVKDADSMPQYNMFNSARVKSLQNTELRDKLEDADIIVPVKSYTEDTDLGPQDIYFLTEKGEKYLTEN